MRWFAVIPGVAILIGSASSVIRSLIVPRASQSRVFRVVGGQITAPLFALAARRRKAWVDQDRILAFAGPVALLGIFGTWLIGFLVGFTLVLWPIDHVSLLGAAREAGSSVFTLGTAGSTRAVATVVDYAAAGVGLLVVALEIAYVPTLYSAFNRREVQVTLLSARAGSPAWGPELLARHRYADMLESLPELYRTWETWAADVAESHTNYPILLFFRSPHPMRSWLLALTSVLDSAALYASLCPDTVPVEARLVLRIGFESLREIADAVGFAYDPDPKPGDPIALSEAEFREGIARLAAVSFPMQRTAEEAWPHFAAWRVNYEAIVLHLAAVTRAAPGRWTGERDWVGTIEARPLINRTPVAPDGASGFRLRE